MLQCLGKRLILLGPLRQPDFGHVLIHVFGNGHAEVAGPRRSQQARCHRSPRHHRRRHGHIVANLPQIHDVLVVGLAVVIPNRGVGGDHIRLVAAVGDHIMHPTAHADMFAAKIPADVHQLHRIQRAAPAPRSPGGVRRLSSECVFDRNHAGLISRPGGHAEVVAHMREQYHVYIFEESLADVVGLRAELLLGDSRPQLERAREMLALHHLLHRQRCHDVQRHARVVAFAMPRRAFDHWHVVRHCRLLRGLRDVINIRTQGDDRLPLPPRGNERGGDARHVPLDLEALLLQKTGEIFGGLKLLEAQLAEAEDAVHHHLRLLLHCIHLAYQIRFHTGGLFRRNPILRRGCHDDQEHRYQLK